MILNDYQKKLIAEGFYSRLMTEDSPDKRIQMILEFMDAFMPKDFPVLQDGTRLFEGPKENIRSFNIGD